MGDRSRPVLIYDADCAFCVRWIERWRRATGEAVEYMPSSVAAERFPAIPPQRTAASVVLLEPDGRAVDGAGAVFASLAYGGRGGLLRLYRSLPGFAAVAERLYRFVAAHRRGLGALERWLLPGTRRAG